MAIPASGSIQWSERYTVGVAEIDRQHRILLAILNEINWAAASDLTQQQIKGLLWIKFDNLNAYSTRHFTFEESLMKSHLAEHPACDTHLAQHQSYWASIGAFQKRYRDTDDKVLPDLIDFLNTWWIDHIQGTDKELGAALNLKGIR